MSYRMVKQKGGMFEFEPWMIPQFQTIELTSYLNPNDFPDDEISIRKFDYWGHDDPSRTEFIMKGGKHTDGSKIPKHNPVIRLGVEMSKTFNKPSEPEPFEGGK